MILHALLTKDGNEAGIDLVSDTNLPAFLCNNHVVLILTIIFLEA